MSKNNCCSQEDTVSNANVTVNVDVPKIVKYACIAGILIVGIIFGTKSFRKMLETGFFDQVK